MVIQKIKHGLNISKLLFAFIFLITVLPTCKKEYSLEAGAPPIITTGTNNISVGTLAQTNGNCAPITANGNYIVATAVTATNNLLVNAEVIKTGSYIFTTDTVAGVYFIAQGSFTNVGTKQITLAAFGTPTAAGVQTFKVTYGASTCTFTINFSAQNNTAQYSFDGAPGSCASPVFGTAPFIAGIALVPNNSITLNVRVTQPGTYTVSTNSVNGISFAVSGIFSNTGINTVFLVPTGTPIMAGTFNYTISSSTSTCSFAVTVAPQIIDYIPTTPQSNYSYSVQPPTGPLDTAFIQVNPGTKTFAGNTNPFNIFERKITGTPQDSTFIRKQGTNYYQYINSTFGILTTPIIKEILILDTTVAIGSGWLIDLGSATFNNIPITLTANALILSKNFTGIFGPLTYNTPIIQIQYTYKAAIPLMGTIDVAREQRWYAKGIGLIKSQIEDLINNTQQGTTLTRFAVF
jgi:hypothetical protein